VRQSIEKAAVGTPAQGTRLQPRSSEMLNQAAKSLRTGMPEQRRGEEKLAPLPVRAQRMRTIFQEPGEPAASDLAARQPAWLTSMQGHRAIRAR